MTQTANERYQELLKEMQAQIDQLQAKIVKHTCDQAKEPKNWGYVGDMSYWVDVLKQITEPK